MALVASWLIPQEQRTSDGIRCHLADLFELNRADSGDFRVRIFPLSTINVKIKNPWLVNDYEKLQDLVLYVINSIPSKVDFFSCSFWSSEVKCVINPLSNRLHLACLARKENHCWKLLFHSPSNDKRQFFQLDTGSGQIIWLNYLYWEARQEPEDVFTNPLSLSEVFYSHDWPLKPVRVAPYP